MTTILKYSLYHQEISVRMLIIFLFVLPSFNKLPGIMTRLRFVIVTQYKINLYISVYNTIRSN